MECFSYKKEKKEKNLHGFPPPTPHPSPNVLADPGEFHGLRFHLQADPDNLYGTCGAMYSFSMVLSPTNV